MPSAESFPLPPVPELGEIVAQDERDVEYESWPSPDKRASRHVDY